MGEDGGGGHHRQVQYIHLKVQCMTDKWIRLDLDDHTTNEPTLAEMTAKALEILQEDEGGFVLFVESALVDKVG